MGAIEKRHDGRKTKLPDLTSFSLQNDRAAHWRTVNTSRNGPRTKFAWECVAIAANSHSHSSWIPSFWILSNRITLILLLHISNYCNFIVSSHIWVFLGFSMSIWVFLAGLLFKFLSLDVYHYCSFITSLCTWSSEGILWGFRLGE